MDDRLKRSEIKTDKDFHEQLKELFDFPEYHGEHFD
jgi:RNAse (barnase) inhibitor barstar